MDLFSYRADASVDRHTPLAVLLPSTAEQFQAAFKVLIKHAIPITCRGAGTGLSGGSVACPGAVILASNRLRRRPHLDPENRRARAQPGVVNLSLSKAGKQWGLHFAPDPSSQKTSTVGGNIAENAGGPHCLKYGVTLNHLNAVTVLDPQSGEAVRLGGPGLESPLFDLRALICGSEGTLAPIVSADLRLTPNPQAVRTLLAIFDSVDAAGRAVTRILERGVLPTALEMIDKLCVEAVEAVIKAGYPKDAEAVLLIEVDGLAAGLEAEISEIKAACQGLAIELREARDDHQRALLWRGRKEAVGALGKLARNYYIQDGVIPRSTLPEVLKHIAEVAQRFELKIGNVFHAGDGNLHPVILFDRRQEGALARVIAAGTAILERCVELGGSLTGEHGVGLEKRHAVGLLFSDKDVALMHELRAIFDPKGLMNPSKIVPRPGACLEGGRLARALEPAPAPPGAPALKIPKWRTVTPSDHERRALEQFHQAREAGGGLQVLGRESFCDAHPERVAWRYQGQDIVRLSPEDMMLTVHAGMSLTDLDQALEPHGLRLPTPELTPGGSLGGALASYAGGGHRRPGHGSLRDRLVGARFITARAELHHWGGAVTKNVAGYDWLRVLLGSRGRLGMFCQASLRLSPRIPGETWIHKDSVSRCLALAERLRASGVPWTALSVLRGGPDLEDPHAGRLLVAVEAVAAARRAAFDQARPLIPDADAVSGAEHEALWAAADAWPSSLRAGFDWYRVSLQPTQLRALAEALPESWPFACRSLCGLLDVYVPRALARETWSQLRALLPQGAWARSLTAQDLSVEAQALSDIERRWQQGLKRLFDPQSALEPLFQGEAA